MNRWISRAGAVCAGMVAGWTATAAMAGPLQNGGFELPALADGAVQQVTPANWSWGGQPGFLFNVAGTAQTAADGVQFVDIGNTPATSLLQDFTVDVAGRYRLSWYDNAVAFFQVAPYRITVSQGLLDLDFDANEGLDGLWTLRTVELDLQPATTYTLAFSPGNIPGPLPAQDRFIDGVSLSAVQPPQPVPEPAGVWLLVSALAGAFGASSRRRSRRSA